MQFISLTCAKDSWKITKNKTATLFKNIYTLAKKYDFGEDRIKKKLPFKSLGPVSVGLYIQQ